MEPSGLRVVRLLAISHQLNLSPEFSLFVQWEERTSPAVCIWSGVSSYKRSAGHVLIPRMIFRGFEEAGRGSRMEIHGRHETAFCARRDIT